LAETPLFDAYLMVDWSAAAEPRQGKDSIWLYQLRRGAAVTSENPRTRHEACKNLHDLLKANLEAGLRTLVGFDFPLGYPAGFAQRLGLDDPPWRAVWRYLAAQIKDDDKNHNNRFDVANELNRRISNGSAPFWGCPPRRKWPFLEPKRHPCSDLNIDPWRLTEKRVKEWHNKTPHSVWKLFTRGCVGSQALTGIPVVERLYSEFCGKGAVVWPFETGLAAPTDAPFVFAEIYPSLRKTQPVAGEVHDAAQVRTLAEYFEEKDARGTLCALFRGDTLSAADRARVESEEGWILGVRERE